MNLDDQESEESAWEGDGAPEESSWGVQLAIYEDAYGVQNEGDVGGRAEFEG